MNKNELFMKIIIIVVFLSSNIIFGQKNPSNAKIKNMIVTEEIHEKGKIKTYMDSEVHYDNHGNVIEKINYKNGEFKEHIICKFDTSDNKIKETELDLEGKIIKIIEYRYSNNLRIEKTEYDKNNEIISRKSYKYIMY
jgi:hypothetical protein